MRPHPRIRKAIKWGGLLFGAALLALTFLSSSYQCFWTWTSGPQMRRLGVEEGLACFSTLTLGSAMSGVESLSYLKGQVIDPANIQWWPSSGRGAYDTLIEVPLWIPALGSFMCSAIAWRLEALAMRRARVGKCPTCSYPRTGLAPSSPCPECGSAAPSA